MEGTPKIMLALIGAAAIVVAAIASLALGSWWILIVVVAVHALASVAVVGYGFKKSSETHDKPDPVTEARVEEEQESSSRPKDREVFN